MMNEFADKLIDWYEENKRELPWRNTKDPYRIWISEVILQQTRVAQGYDYFVRFMERFPDVSSLAEADEDEVMKYWQGLGYYSRARNLHAAAKSMVPMGGFPTTYQEVCLERSRGIYGCGYLFVRLRYAFCGGGWKCISGTFPMAGHRYPH